MSAEAPGAEPGDVRDAWLEVGDDLLQGVGHALNNRVAAVTAVGQVLAASSEGPLADALSAESGRLQRAVQLLRLLVRRWDDEPEPLTVQDVLADVLELVGHHPRVRNLEIRVQADDALMPVRAERTSLTHAFCLLIAPAAEAAEREGAAALTLRCTGSMESVQVEIPLNGAGDADGTEGRGGYAEPPGAEVDPRSARGLFQRAGGELEIVEAAGARVALRVRLPTLMEVRRREREQQG